MKQKWLAVGIILLFVGIAYTPALAQNIEKSLPVPRGTWLYVGGTGPENYTRIQDAIDNSSNEDTVFVYNGEYNDFYPDGQFGYTVNVNKEIRLLGEDKNHTIINGTGHAITVRVSANNVEINGFTIQNGGGSFCGGVRIMDGKYRTRVRYNIIKNNNAGVFMMWNRDVDIRNNIIEKNGNGLYIYDSTTTDIMDNIIANNTNGIVIVYGNIDAWFFPINAIVYNEIRDNEKGIQADDTQFIAQCNNFIKNGKHVDIGKGISLLSIILYIKKRNFWSRNYWDDLETGIPRRIKGQCVIYIQLPREAIPIFQIPYYETDPRPPTTPYDIWSRLYS